MNDDELGKLLRTARPPTKHDPARGRLWLLLMERVNERPRWSLLDVGLGVAAAAALLLSPDGLWLLAYHL
jgi:hypothetical protein